MTMTVYNEAMKINKRMGKDIILIPSNGFKKSPINPKTGNNLNSWNNLDELKKFNLEDLKDNRVTGLSTVITHSKDLVCIDIDVKTKKGFSLDQITKVYNIVMGLTEEKLPIYVEQSVSGEGIHIFFKLTKEQSEYVRSCFDTGRRDKLMVEVEYFDTNRQMLIYPSSNGITQCKKLYNNMWDIDYLLDEQLKIIISYLKKMEKIVGSLSKVTELNKNGIEYTVSFTKKGDLEIDDNIKKRLHYINNKYFKLNEINETSLKIRHLAIKRLLDDLGEQYVSELRKKYDFAVYSFFDDDGNNPDSYFYCNFKGIVYYDFHTNKKYDWLETLYVKYGESLFKSINKLFNIETKVNKPTIIVKDRDELYLKIKENKNKKILVLAGTGFGKSSTLKKLSKEQKILMIEPLAVQVAQEHQTADWNTACLWKDTTQINRKRDWNNVNLLFTTSAQIKEYYNKYENLEHLIVVDEAHTLISDMSYREKTIQKVWELINKRDNWIMMTATPKFCGLEEHCDIIIKVENQKKKNRFVRKCIIKDKKNISYYDAICSRIKKSDDKYGDDVFHIIYIDSENDLKTYKEKIEKIMPNKKIKLITSKEVESNPELINDIVERRQIESNILLCTRKLSMGYHIEQNGKFEFHTINGDINIIEQMINRIRHYDSNGNELNNSATVNLYTKSENVVYVDYNKRYDLYYNNLKDFTKQIDFKENEFIYTDFMTKLKLGNEYTLKGLIYESLVAESKYNVEYLVREIEESGWDRIKDIPIKFADKIKVDKIKGVDNKSRFIEIFKYVINEINEGKNYNDVCAEWIGNYIKYKIDWTIIKNIKNVCSLNKLDELNLLVNDEEMTYNKIIRRINEWKIKSDVDNTNIKEVIKDYVKDKEYIPTKELKEYVGKVEKANSIIKSVMVELGYVNKRKRCEIGNVQCWCKL